MDQELKESNSVLDIILSLVTFGLYYFYWQYKQIKTINKLLGEKRHSYIKWFFLSIITLFLYHIYHEYLYSKDIIEIQEMYKDSHGMKVLSQDFPVLCLIISIFGMALVSDIIHDVELNTIIKKLNARLYV